MLRELGNFIRRILYGLKAVGPALLAIAGTAGCESEASDTVPKPAAIAQPATELPKKVEEPKPLGQFTITFYYVIGEDEVAPKKPANDNDDSKSSAMDLVGIMPQDDRVTLYEPTKCNPIADVAPEFATQLTIQGTGKLKDGRVLNIWGHCSCSKQPCFKATENQWGTAGTGHPLQPFRTVAVDPKVVKLGTLLYVPLLEGRVMPGRAPWGGFVHDGCVVADDTGGGIDGNQLDLFTGRKGYFLGLSGSGGSHAWARHVPVFDGSSICERKGRHVARKSGSI